MLTAVEPLDARQVGEGRRRVAAVSPDEALEALKVDYLALRERRERRRPTGRVHTIRCGHCYRFKTSLTAVCKACGWDPATGWD